MSQQSTVMIQWSCDVTMNHWDSMHSAPFEDIQLKGLIFVILGDQRRPIFYLPLSSCISLSEYSITNMECFPIKRDSNDERKQESLKSSFSPLPTLLSYVSSKTHSTFFLALSLKKHFLTLTRVSFVITLLLKVYKLGLHTRRKKDLRSPFCILRDTFMVSLLISFQTAEPGSTPVKGKHMSRCRKPHMQLWKEIQKAFIVED